MPLGGLRDWGTLTAGCGSVDAEIVKDATKCKMDLPGGLQRTLHGTVKPSMYLRTCFSTLLLSYIYILAILHLHLHLYYTVPTLIFVLSTLTTLYSTLLSYTHLPSDHTMLHPPPLLPLTRRPPPQRRLNRPRKDIRTAAMQPPRTSRTALGKRVHGIGHRSQRRE